MVNYRKLSLPELFRACQEDNDPRARETILANNCGLVWGIIVRHYEDRGEPVEDLFQEGMLGLNRAIDDFNYLGENKFSTYASHWIRGYIQNYLKKPRGIIKIPKSAIILYAKISEEISKGENDIETIAVNVGRKKETIAEFMALGYLFKTTSLDARVKNGDDSSTATLKDILGDSRAIDPSVVVDQDTIEKAIKKLGPSQRFVIEKKYYQGWDLKDLREAMGCSKQNVHQKEQIALGNLKKHLIAYEELVS